MTVSWDSPARQARRRGIAIRHESGAIGPPGDTGLSYSAPGGGSSSVLYSAASAVDLAMKAACALASSGGGAFVRVATGWPTRVKNSSCPEGAHMHSSRDGVSVALVNACGGVGRHVDGVAGAGDERLAAEGYPDFAVKHGEHLLEVVPVRRRRCRCLRSDARSAPAIRPGMGRHMPPPARHLRQWPASALMASTARRHRPAGTRQMRVHDTACRPDTVSGVAARESHAIEDVHPQCGRELCALARVNMSGSREPSRSSDDDFPRAV
jgi:hypothetical protein